MFETLAEMFWKLNWKLGPCETKIHSIVALGMGRLRVVLGCETRKQRGFGASALDCEGRAVLCVWLSRLEQAAKPSINASSGGDKETVAERKCSMGTRGLKSVLRRKKLRVQCLELGVGGRVLVVAQVSRSLAQNTHRTGQGRGRPDQHQPKACKCQL